MLTELFWHSPLTVRYGIAENLKGWDAITAFRQARPAVDLDRDLMDTVITTYGRDFATASTEYRRKQSGRRGPAEPDLAAHAGRLARGGGARQPAAGLDAAKIAYNLGALPRG